MLFSEASEREEQGTVIAEKANRTSEKKKGKKEKKKESTVLLPFCSARNDRKSDSAGGGSESLNKNKRLNKLNQFWEETWGGVASLDGRS